MCEPTAPAGERERRKQAVQERLWGHEIDGLLVTHPADLFYLTGEDGREAFLLPREGEPVMVDFAVQMDGYHMDETRMLSMGPLPREAEDACRAATEVHA